jgi:hypothetical protein
MSCKGNADFDQASAGESWVHMNGFVPEPGQKSSKRSYLNNCHPYFPKQKHVKSQRIRIYPDIFYLQLLTTVAQTRDKNYGINAHM